MTQRMCMRVAERLKKALDGYPQDTLPSLAKLSIQFGVSRSTMISAVHALAREGLLECQPGRRARLKCKQENLHHAEQTPLEKVKQSLLLRIEQGVFQSRHALPKRAWFANEFGVCLPTITKALRQLASHNLLHRQGRQWMVGPPAEKNVGVRPGDSSTDPHDRYRSIPYILLLQRRELSWWNLTREERSRKFTLVFDEEVAKHGVQVLPVFALKPTGDGIGCMVSGKEGVRSLIKSSADRYLGTIIAGDTHDIPDLESWIKMFAATRRPVVWFDRYNEPYPPKVADPMFTRCRFSEENGLSLALEHLSCRGHCSIAYINPTTHDQWLKRRGALLSTIAGGEYSLNLQILTPPPPGELPPGVGRSAISDAFVKLFTQGFGKRNFFDKYPTEPGAREHDSSRYRISDTRNSITKLIAGSPGIPWGDLVTVPSKMHLHTQLLLLIPLALQLISMPAITAVVLPNDYLARRFYLLLRLLGIEVPKHMSMISFDNYSGRQVYPITSIDFGFGSLGYAAFHRILGDLPVHRDAPAEILCRPSVFQRGSVGLPATIRQNQGRTRRHGKKPEK